MLIYTSLSLRDKDKCVYKLVTKTNWIWDKITKIIFNKVKAFALFKLKIHIKILIDLM